MSMSEWKLSRIERESALHVAGVLGQGSVSPDSWRSIDEDMDAVKECVNRLYGADAALELLRDDQQVMQALSAAMDQPGRPVARRRYGWAMVASVLLVVSIIGVWSEFRSVSDQDVAYRHVARIGEQKQVLLEDGSRMILNTGSEALVSYGDDYRHVVISRGEVFFDVEKDAERLFRVEVGDRSIAVLGTAFNVRRKRDGFELSVEEGTVALYATGNTLDREAVSVSEVGDEVLHSADQRRVAAGWQVDVSNGLLSASVAKEVAGWRSGIVHFVDKPMMEVVKELNRYSVKKILVEDPEVMTMRVTASVNVKRIPSVLRVMAQGYGLKFEEGFDYLSLAKKQ